SPDPTPMPATTPQRQQAPAASNLARTARLGGAVLCALVVLLLGAMLWSSHAHEFRHGSASVDNLARAVEQQLWLGLRDAEDDLHGIAREASPLLAAGADASALASVRALLGPTSWHRSFAALALLDAEGRVLAARSTQLEGQSWRVPGARTEDAVDPQRALGPLA